MRYFLGLLLLTSCAHENIQTERPAWVGAIRSGEEKLKVPHGSKTYYRRIAGGKDVSKQTSCELSIMKAEEDIKKEYPLLPKIPYAVEVLFYDEDFNDCAVTLSVNSDLKHRYDDLKKLHQLSINRRDELLTKENVTDEEAAEILNFRSDVAMRFALTGLPKDEFEKFSKEKVVINQGPSLCSPVFKTNAFSIHGTTHVCWQSEHVQGYCTLKDKQCWTRTP